MDDYPLDPKANTVRAHSRIGDIAKRIIVVHCPSGIFLLEVSPL